MMGEVTGDWLTLHIEKLHNFYYSQNTTRVMKLRSIRLAGNVARMKKLRGVYRVLIEELGRWKQF